MGTAAVTGKNDKVTKLFSIVLRDGVFTLVPFGDLSLTHFGMEIYPENVRLEKSGFKMLVDSDYLDVEAICEDSPKPVCTPENLAKAELVLGDSFLFVKLKFSDDDGEEDPNFTVVRANIALEHYPELNEIIFEDVTRVCKNIDDLSVFTFSEQEVANFPRLDKFDKYSYSPNNILIPKSWAATNLNPDLDNVFYAIESFVGPKRPTKNFPEYGMWLADMLTYALPEDKPKLYVAPVSFSGGKGKGKGKMLMTAQHLQRKEEEKAVQAKQEQLAAMAGSWGPAGGWADSMPTQLHKESKGESKEEESKDEVQESKEESKDDMQEESKTQLSEWVDELTSTETAAGTLSALAGGEDRLSPVAQHDDLCSLTGAVEDEEDGQEDEEAGPSETSKADLLTRLKYNIEAKCPDFTFYMEIEQFPYMTRLELMNEIQATRVKIGEEKAVTGKRKRVRPFFHPLSSSLLLLTPLPLLLIALQPAEPAIPAAARVRVDQDALGHPDLFRGGGRHRARAQSRQVIGIA